MEVEDVHPFLPSFMLAAMSSRPCLIERHRQIESIEEIIEALPFWNISTLQTSR